VYNCDIHVSVRIVPAERGSMPTLHEGVHPAQNSSSNRIGSTLVRPLPTAALQIFELCSERLQSTHLAAESFAGLQAQPWLLSNGGPLGFGLRLRLSSGDRDGKALLVALGDHG
jgi:hypothetical protein